MAIPNKKQLADIVLKFLSNGRAYSLDGIEKHVRGSANMSAVDLNKKNSRGQYTWKARIPDAIKLLIQDGFIETTKSARFKITEAGRQSLTESAPRAVSGSSEDVHQRLDCIQQQIDELQRQLDQLKSELGQLVPSRVPERTTVPKQIEIEVLLLQLMQDGRVYTRQGLKTLVLAATNLSESAQSERLSGGEMKWENTTDWAVTSLKHKGLIERVRRAEYRITDAGKKFLLTAGASSD